MLEPTSGSLKHRTGANENVRYVRDFITLRIEKLLALITSVCTFNVKEKAKVTTPNLPAFLQNTQSRLTDTLGSNLGGGSHPYLSIMGNRLTLVDASGDQEPITTVDPKTGLAYLDCVIIDVGDHASKIYYGKPYDPNAQSWAPPDCWSDNGVAPSINASVPQARSCTPDPTGIHGCKWAVWGSKVSTVSGKGVPACSKYQKLALLIPGDEVIFLLRVPPNSLDNLRAYNAKFKGQQIGIDAVITRLSFEPQGLGTLTFNAQNYVDEASWKQSRAAIAAKATDTLVGRGDVPIAGVALAAPLAAPTAALPAPTQSFVPQQQPSAPVTLPSTPTPPAAASVTPASPSEAAPRTRKRRTAQELAAAPQVGQQAPFRPAEAPSGVTSATPNGPAFGIDPKPPAPNAEMEATLKGIFGA